MKIAVDIPEKLAKHLREELNAMATTPISEEDFAAIVARDIAVRYEQEYLSNGPDMLFDRDYFEPELEDLGYERNYED